MFQRKSNALFIFIGINISLFFMMLGHAAYQRNADAVHLKEKRMLVKTLGLSDMCLFTDARYTRHPSMADINTPFQDSPMSFEHFPSGSLIEPPPHLRGTGS